MPDDERSEPIDDDGIPKRWKRMRWYAGAPAALLGLILGVLGLMPYCQSTAWQVVESPALTQAKTEIVKYHTNTSDDDGDGAPDGHDHQPHSAAAPKATAEKNKSDIDKLTTAVTDLTGAVGQLVVVVNVDKCEALSDGWSPYGEDCIRIDHGRIVKKVPLSETDTLRNLKKVSVKVKAAVERSIPQTP